MKRILIISLTLLALVGACGNDVTVERTPAPTATPRPTPFIYSRTPTNVEAEATARAKIKEAREQKIADRIAGKSPERTRVAKIKKEEEKRIAKVKADKAAEKIKAERNAKKEKVPEEKKLDHKAIAEEIYIDQLRKRENLDSSEAYLNKTEVKVLWEKYLKETDYDFGRRTHNCYIFITQTNLNDVAIYYIGNSQWRIETFKIFNNRRSSWTIFEKLFEVVPDQNNTYGC